MATDSTIVRVAQAGAIPSDAFAMVAELMRTWNPAEGSRFGAIIADHIVLNYKCLMESFEKAKGLVKLGPETRMDKSQ